MKIAVLSLTRGGAALAKSIAEGIKEAVVIQREPQQKLAGLLQENWHRYDAFICVMATGIVVRHIAPLLKDKALDPCVVVTDERGANVISLVSGHLGGGNELTLRLADFLGANPVITTASDTLGLVSLDLWAKDCNLVPPSRPVLTALSTRLVNRGLLKIYTSPACPLPKGLVATTDPVLADIVVTNSRRKEYPGAIFRPKDLIIGTGCNRGTAAVEFESALIELLKELQLSRKSIRNLASIDKKSDEKGLLQFAEENGWKIDFFPKEELNAFTSLDVSQAAMKAVGAIGVAEPAALLSAATTNLLCRKKKWKNLTMAVAKASYTLSVPDPETKPI